MLDVCMEDVMPRPARLLRFRRLRLLREVVVVLALGFEGGGTLPEGRLMLFVIYSCLIRRLRAMRQVGVLLSVMKCI
jgi:hypothetical protein